MSTKITLAGEMLIAGIRDSLDEALGYAVRAETAMQAVLAAEARISATVLETHPAPPPPPPPTPAPPPPPAPLAITSPATAPVAENDPLAHILTASEPGTTWAITGGADAALFELAGSTLRWAGDGTKDFEAPDDSNADNIYQVDVQATDLAGRTSPIQSLSVTVTDVAEGQPPTPPPTPGTLTSATFTDKGTTFTLAAPAEYAVYPNGEYRVLGPVSIVSITPAAELVSGNYDNGVAYAGKWVHGTQVNPGNRSWAGGSTNANKDNIKQGLQGIPSITNLSGLAYLHASNQDPGATGVPLAVTTGSVFHLIARDGRSGRPAQPRDGRPGGYEASLLTVVNNLGAANACRPGVAQADKTHHFTTDDFDLSVFPSVAKVAGAPSVAAILANIRSPWQLQTTDTVNSSTIAAERNGNSGYPRELALRVGDAAMALCFDYTDAEKMQILDRLYCIAIDGHERAREGGDPTNVGGLAGANGAAWRKVALTMVAAALHGAADTAKLAEMVAMCDAQANFVFPEDKMVPETTQAIVDYGGQGSTSARQLDSFPQWMRDTFHFSSGAANPRASGSNLDAAYLAICGTNGIGGMTAMRRTAGASALWNREGTWEYHRSFRAREEGAGRWTLGGVFETLSSLRRQQVEALWPADNAPPALVAARSLGNTLWLRFDKALDEFAAISAADFTVKVNGVTVAATRAPPPVRNHPGSTQTATNGVFNTNVGLILSSSVTSADVVTVAYAGGAGANKVRSAIDNVVAAAFTAHPVENLTPSVGGTNAAYPVVRFAAAAPSIYRPPVPIALGANSPRFTLWIPNFKFSALPGAETVIFGASNAKFNIALRPSGRLRIMPRASGSASTFRRFATPALTPGVAYNILLACDVSQTSSAAGIKLIINGTAVADSALEKTDAWGAAVPDVGFASAYLYGFNSGAVDHEWGGFWLFPGQFITTPAQVAKFASLTGGSLDIGTLGAGITGAQPPLFLVGNASQLNDEGGFNRGSGPRFYLTAGPGVADVSGSEWR